MPEELATQIGANARRARAAAGLTQEEVALRLDVTSEFYSRIERGRSMPSLSTLVRLAGVLGCRERDLLDDEESAAQADDMRATVRRLAFIASSLADDHVRLLSTLAEALAAPPLTQVDEQMQCQPSLLIVGASSDKRSLPREPVMVRVNPSVIVRVGNKSVRIHVDCARDGRALVIVEGGPQGLRVKLVVGTSVIGRANMRADTDNATIGPFEVDNDAWRDGARIELTHEKRTTRRRLPPLPRRWGGLVGSE